MSGATAKVSVTLRMIGLWWGEQMTSLREFSSAAGIKV
jgi:hypothetical protein